MNVTNIGDIHKLASGDEGGRTEYKLITRQLERGTETLCAFLSGEGGTILLGVADSGKITDQEMSDRTEREIAEAIHLFEPFTTVAVSYANISDTDKQVIVLYAEERRYMRPFTYKGRIYQRVENVTSVMSQDKYNRLLMQRGGKYSWEAIPNPDLQISDLDENVIIGAVRAGINCGRLPETTIREEIPAILEKFDLLHDGKLNNAAAVLFGRNLYDYPQCLLQVAKFRGTSKEEFIDNQGQQGNIYALLDATMLLFFKHLSLSGRIEGLYREEKLSIPYKALRRCCINAFCHRAYHRPDGSVDIAIYDDRVEIESSGTFPPDMALEKLLGGHNLEPPNFIIAGVLCKSELLENWGRGISLMIDECHRAGMPDPEFHTDGDSVWVVFRYEIEMAGQASDKHPTSIRQIPDKYPTSIVRLIELIGEHTCSLKEMMGVMELKDRENFLGNYPNPSMGAGLVEPLYPDQPEHPRQRYRLTEQRKALLERGE